MTVHRDLNDLSSMTAGWLLPIVAPIVASATGSVVAEVLEPDQALITIIVSYALLGLGLPTAIMIFAVYFHRLTMHKLPPLQHMASTFLPLGPLGQGGFAAQKLGAQAMRVFPLTNALPLAGSTLAGHTLYVLGFITALILWGFGTLWFFFAVSSVSTRKFPFGLGWWAFTFPLGVYALSTISLGQELPSLAFRTLGTVFGSAVILMWAVVWLMVVGKIASGKVFDVFKAPELFGTNNVK
jgi:tellurite resistance protein TehA-like permease